MRFGSARPNGYRLDRNYRGKIKMMNFTVLPPPYDKWPYMWGSEYDHARNTQWVEVARVNGFNAIRVFAASSPWDGPTGGVNIWPDNATFRQRVREFVSMVRAKNMLLNVTLASKASALGNTSVDRAGIIPGIVDYCKIWMDEAADIIIFVDGINEMNIDVPQSWGGGRPGSPNAQARDDMFYYFGELRKVTAGVPLTISVTTSGQDNIIGANEWFDLQYDLGCDLHDIHCYWGGAPVSSGDLAIFEARPKYIGRYIISEIGNPQNDPDSKIISLNNSVSDIAARPQCLGAGLWCVTPSAHTFSAPIYDYGFTSDVAGTTPRLVKQMTTKNWPNRA